jgi:hypothetical protein
MPRLQFHASTPILHVNLCPQTTYVEVSCCPIPVQMLGKVVPHIMPQLLPAMELA